MPEARCLRELEFLIFLPLRSPSPSPFLSFPFSLFPLHAHFFHMGLSDSKSYCFLKNNFCKH